MKDSLILLFCLLVGFTASSQSQNLEIPKTEFSVSTTDSLTIEKGSYQKLDVWVLRSKRFAKHKVKLGVSSSLPEGVVINFGNQKEYFDLCEATISVTPEAKPGTYFIIISGSIRYKSKGEVVKLIIDEARAEAIGGQ